MISLLQDLSRNINNIRLYNNQIFKTNKIDKNRIKSNLTYLYLKTCAYSNLH